jgi:hypothetical protein
MSEHSGVIGRTETTLVNAKDSTAATWLVINLNKRRESGRAK